jgi:hypothetical protein
LSISTVFDSGFAESLEYGPRAIGAAIALAASPKLARPHCDPLPTVEPRPPPAMHDALQFKLVFVRTPMHFEKRFSQRYFARALYSSAPHLALL